METEKNLLRKILDAIDFKGDKEAFIQKLLSLIYTQAFTELLSLLPEEQQQEMADVLEKNTPMQFLERLQGQLNEEQIKNAFQKATEETIADYLETIDPKLTDEQRKKLETLSTQMNPQ